MTGSSARKLKRAEVNLLGGRAWSFKLFPLTYTDTYLKEEIRAESIVRNIPAFSRFLELAADQSGMSVNYNNFARETGLTTMLTYM